MSSCDGGNSDGKQKTAIVEGCRAQLGINGARRLVRSQVARFL